MHKDIPEVKAALQLTRKERIRKFAEFRKRGIYKANIKEMESSGSPKLQRARNRGKAQMKDLVHCNICKICIKRANFAKHRKLCSQETSVEPGSVSFLRSDLLQNTASHNFKEKILQNFRDDEEGKICRSDEILQVIGQNLWSKERKTDKESEMKKSVMGNMRRLAQLFKHFKENALGENSSEEVRTVADMFIRTHFTSLERAIEDMTLKEDGKTLSAGLKLGLRYLIQNSAEILQGYYLINNNDYQAKEIEKFLRVFKMKRFYIFGDAEYKIKKDRQVKLRKPQEMPGEDDLKNIKGYTLQRIQDLTTDSFYLYSKKEYVELRDLVVTRLTIFNARRGGEPARLKLGEWADAEKGVWISGAQLGSLDIPQEDRELLENIKIAYQAGKGNKLVSLLIPADVVKAIEILTDISIRKSVGVDCGNDFVFPFTQFSVDHASGWHSMRNIVDAVDTEDPSRVTATKIRHRTSTLFALLNTTDQQKQRFYQHMGHSSDINRDIYQAPPAVSTILDVGKRLDQFDKGTCVKLKVHHCSIF